MWRLFFNSTISTIWKIQLKDFISSWFLIRPNPKQSAFHLVCFSFFSVFLTSVHYLVITRNDKSRLTPAGGGSPLMGNNLAFSSPAGFNYFLLFTLKSSCPYLLTNFPYLLACWQPLRWISSMLLPRRSSVAHSQRRPLWISRRQFKKEYTTYAGYNAGERTFKRSTVDVPLKIKRTLMWMQRLLFQLWLRFLLLLAVIPIKL